MVREPLLCEVAQLVGHLVSVLVAAIPTRNHVRHQPRLACHVLPTQYCHILNGLMVGKHGLDLTQLNAKASDLYLLIISTNEFQLAI
jgi:hypothetical protein